MLDVFGLFKVDTLYVVIGLLVITIAAIVLAIVAICNACAMTKKYEMMMEGSDGKSMEKMVRKYTDDIINLQRQVKIIQKLLRTYMKRCSLHSRRLVLISMMHSMKWVES